MAATMMPEYWSMASSPAMMQIRASYRRQVAASAMKYAG